MRILVTGANGFVGSAVAARLVSDGNAVRGAVRGAGAALPAGVERVVIGDLSEATDWRRAVEDIDAVVHAAARVHVMRDDAADPLTAFRRANAGGTRSLAR